MSNKNYIDADKLNGLMKEIWEVAVSKGWHDNPISKMQYLGLIVTEAAEAVEADRVDKRAKTDMMIHVMKVQDESEIGLCQEWYKTWFEVYYDEYVKGSIEEEFADMIIRILDMTWELHGEKMNWVGYDTYGESYDNSKKFVETFWIFVKEVLNWGRMNITDSIAYIYSWAEHGCGITPETLDMHIRWKMKKNELRPYKHGGKKY